MEQRAVADLARRGQAWFMVRPSGGDVASQSFQMLLLPCNAATRVCLHAFVPELFRSCAKHLHGCVFVVVWLKAVCGLFQHSRSHSPFSFEGNSFPPRVPHLCILVMNSRVARACLCGLLPCCFAWQYCTLRCAERPSFGCVVPLLSSLSVAVATIPPVWFRFAVCRVVCTYLSGSSSVHTYVGQRRQRFLGCSVCCLRLLKPWCMHDLLFEVGLCSGSIP